MNNQKVKLPYCELAKEGLSSLLHNIFDYLKILKVPVLCNMFAFVILLTATDSITPQNPPSLFAVVSLLFLIILSVYILWKQLLCIGAVSYLEKDIFDGKELQPAKMYYHYIEKFQGSFLLLFLLTALLFFGAFMGLGIVLAIYFGFFVAICSFLSTVAQVIVWIVAIIAIALAFLQFVLPFFVGLFFSYIYFPLEDKTSLVNVIKKSIKLCYKNRDLTSAITLILVFVGLINIVLNVIFFVLEKLANSLIFVSVTFDIFGIAFGCILSYVSIFIITKVYLEIKKQGTDKI